MIFGSLRKVFLLPSLLLICTNAAIPNVNDSLPGPRIYQIVISEIMADPLPRIDLPEFEYIEIFNRSNTSVDLSGMWLCIGNRKVQLPAAVISSKEYGILCDMETDSIFSGYGKTLPVSMMPPILNTGNSITLKSPDGKIIHSVSFSDTWYGSDEASSGGRSLEIIDTENPCGRVGNWGASKDMAGGTPGKINSVSGYNHDILSPFLIRATLPSDSTVLLHFSEAMHPDAISDPDNYSANNGLFHPDEIYPVEPDMEKVLLNYGKPIKEDCIYSVSVLNTLQDCTGNLLNGKSYADFALPGTPEIFDIVINEILFNAAEKKPEFIELYNRSEKVIELSSLTLALLDQSTFEIRKKLLLLQYPFILFPHHYVVLARDIHRFPEFSGKSLPESMLELPLFTLPDEEGMIVLSDTAGITIDEFYYTKDMHESMLKEVSGISLERVNPELPSDDNDNWHSASTACGYSTPGFQNSQMNTGSNHPAVTMSSVYISPDHDGTDDQMIIHLQLNEPGWMGSFTVYNVEGKVIKSLIRSAMLGTEEDITWDGTCEDGSIAEIGLYVLFGELFNSDGKSKIFKKVIPLVIK